MFKKLFIKNDYVMEYYNLLPACRNGSLENNCNNIATVSSISSRLFIVKLKLPK